MKTNYSKSAAGTFKLNKCQPIHRWYSYIEGYSSCLIEDIVDEIGSDNISTIYDPFCGTGTTSLVAASRGIASFYSETNPFMRDVIEAKINDTKKLLESGTKTNNLSALLEEVKRRKQYANSIKYEWSGFEKFFNDDVRMAIESIITSINLMENDESRRIANVALGAIAVRVSNMVRQGDLRKARSGEKEAEDFDVYANFIQKLTDIINDINDHGSDIKANTVLAAPDARDIELRDCVDCVITSPPYLNGTNYIRNTKLELKTSGHIDLEKDLPAFHSKGIIAGINNVSRRNNANLDTTKYALEYLKELIPVAYDQRIPLMVAGYFRDMENVIKKLSIAVKDGGYFVMDIGDSQFAGVHIPTHSILADICADYGFQLYDDETLRERRSKNGMVLSQRLLKFRKASK